LTIAEVVGVERLEDEGKGLLRHQIDLAFSVFGADCALNLLLEVGHAALDVLDVSPVLICKIEGPGEFVARGDIVSHENPLAAVLLLGVPGAVPGLACEARGPSFEGRIVDCWECFFLKRGRRSAHIFEMVGLKAVHMVNQRVARRTPSCDRPIFG